MTNGTSWGKANGEPKAMKTRKLSDAWAVDIEKDEGYLRIQHKEI